MKKRIAFYIPFYGVTLGGAPDLCKKLSIALSRFFSVDVITTRRGERVNEDREYYGYDVFLRRFDRAASDSERKQDSIEDFLKVHQMDYSALLVIPATGTFQYGIRDFSNVICMPLAHEIIGLQTGAYPQMMENAAGFLWNSIEEKERMEKYYDLRNRPEAITTFFLDEINVDTIVKRPDEGEYILYVGRVSPQKNVAELTDFFIRYKHKHPSNLKLVILGHIYEGMTLSLSEDVIFKGFCPEEEKASYLQYAKCLVLPSIYESLSIVVLESLQRETPVLVNGQCDVLKGQCLRSGGGLYYENYNEFEQCLTFLLNDTKTTKMMGESGADFVRQEYNKERVIANIISVIDSIEQDVSQRSPINMEYHCAFQNPFDIVPIISRMKEDAMVNPQVPSDKEIGYRRFIALAESAKQIVIVGAGNLGLEAYEILSNAKVNSVVAFADNNTKGEGEKFGMPIVAMNEAVRRFPNALFLVTPLFSHWELMEQLGSLGVKKENIDIYLPGQKVK